MSSLARTLKRSEQDSLSIEQKENIEKELLIQLSKVLGVLMEVLETFSNENPMCHIENFSNTDQCLFINLKYNTNNLYAYITYV